MGRRTKNFLSLFLAFFVLTTFVSAGNKCGGLVRDAVDRDVITLPVGKILVRGADIFFQAPGQEMQDLKYTLKDGEQALVSHTEDGQNLAIYVGGLPAGTYGALKGEGDDSARVFRLIDQNDEDLQSLMQKHATLLQRYAAGDLKLDPSKVHEIKITA